MFGINKNGTKHKLGIIMPAYFPASRITRESVSVTTDGTRSYTNIFNALFALVDVNKLTAYSKLENSSTGSINVNIYTITQFTPTQFRFCAARGGDNGSVCEEAILNASTSTYVRCEGSTRQDWGTAKPSSGSVFTIYY